VSLDVSLRLLRAFATVAKEGNVGRAAQRLYVSQPALSQDIRRLERLVGVELFVRTARGMEVTPPGATLLAGIESGLLSIDRAVAEAMVLGGVDKRRVRIAFSPSIGNRLMPTLIPILERLMPDLAVDEREVDTGEVGPGVREGRYDLGFAHCPSREPGLSLSLLTKERVCVAIGASHPLAQRGRVRLADLTGLGIVLWPRETAPDYFDHLLAICGRAGLEPTVIAGPRRAIIRSYLLSNGTCFCLLPESTARLSVPGVAFVRLRDEDARVPLVAVRRSDDRRRDVVAVEEIAKDQIDSLLP
jgi:LysR family transcriptional regulator, benzoate and cis,cis-muconate-responsive activator of ben and cat genes